MEVKRIFKTILILCLLFVCTLKVEAAKISQVVILDTSMTEAEQILLDTVKFYDGKVTLMEADKKRHIYTVRYNMFNYASMYNKPTVNVNVNSKDITNQQNNSTVAYGGFSCNLKAINNGKDILCTSRKYCLTTDYIFSHYKKYYKELSLNGKQVISYKKYLKGKYNRSNPL